jgi:hypothetical protein
MYCFSNKNILLLFLLLFSSCHSEGTIAYRDKGKAYDRHGNLFSGVVKDYRDDGSLGSMSTYRNGVRRGKWEVYGYENEIIQYGKSFTLDDYPLPELANLPCESIELDEWHEGENEYFDIHIHRARDQIAVDSLAKKISLQLKRKVHINLIE